MADLQMKVEGSNVDWISDQEGHGTEKVHNTVETSLVFEPDPDLIVEVDIPLNATDRTHTSSEGYRRWTGSSGSSGVKSRHRRAMSGKSGGKSATTPSSSVLRTRGRPIKPHEVMIT